MLTYLRRAIKFDDMALEHIKTNEEQYWSLAILFYNDMKLLNDLISEVRENLQKIEGEVSFEDKKRAILAGEPLTSAP